MKYKLIYIVPLIAFWALSCKTAKPSYTLNRYDRAQLTDSTLIIGTVQNKKGERFSGAAIKVNGKEIYKANRNGIIKFNLSPGEYYFTGLWIHYKPVETKTIKVNSSDSIRINFVLEEDISLY